MWGWLGDTGMIGDDGRIVRRGAPKSEISSGRRCERGEATEGKQCAMMLECFVAEPVLWPEPSAPRNHGLESFLVCSSPDLPIIPTSP
jgi:hypothetical protein